MSKTIMLVCSAGMSTSLLVSKMQSAAKASGIDATIFATAASDADNQYDSQHPDIMMLGPQVRFMLGNFKEQYPQLPITVIDQQDYGLMRGEKVLQTALELIQAD